MMTKYIYITLISLLFSLASGNAFSDDMPGTAYSRPNVSGGYDFYDSEGSKIGFSSRDKDGDYVYYDTNGSIVGKLKFDVKKGKYRFYDGDNIKKGELSKDRYGGYRYKKSKSDNETSMQMRIRKDYDYANPYGEGVETLPLEVIRGEKTTSKTTASSAGLDTTSEGTGLDSSSSSLKTIASELKTSPAKSSGLSTNN
ncbi:MAG: hypothetical protein ABH843_03830 [Candidatus Omnitrophota bacterium]